MKEDDIQTEFVAGVLICNNVDAVRRVSLIEGEHIQAEFVAGVLICNNVVAVRRVSLIEGVVSRQSLWLEFSYVTMWSLLGG